MQDITSDVLATTAGAADARVRTMLDALVRHLHAFVREVALTQGEWAHAIDFVTRTGQLCTPQRQEFVLLSDVLGITTLVDQVNRRDGAEATENSVLGPFFRTERPAAANGTDISAGLPGVPLQVLTVRSADGRPVPGAKVDVWHSDGGGR